MVKSKQIRAAMGGRPTMQQLIAEAVELWDEVVNFNVNGIIDESSDVAWFIWAISYDKTGINCPAIGAERCWSKYLSRRQTWEKIFTQHNLRYHPRYTAGGTNYNKPAKVELALSLARKEQL